MNINNAGKLIKVQEEFGSFDSYIWQFTGGTTIKNKWRSMEEIPATSEESDLMSKALKKCAFKFAGSTTCHASLILFMKKRVIA